MNVLELRQAYWRNGYRPVAIYTKQKRPWGNGWRADAFADPPLWVARPPLTDALSTGIATGPVVAVDIDVLDQLLCARLTRGVERIVGISPLVRIGRAPKALLCYGCRGEPFRKLTTGDFILPDGTTAHVEILADGQQFVADGVHPDTNAPYRWTGATPADVPLSELPTISELWAKAIIAMAYEMLAAVGKPKVAQRQERPGTGDTFFAQVNSLALNNLALWVRQLFPTATYQGATGAWRVHSRDRGRPDLEEDISFHPDGIRDYGLEQPLTPIDAVLAWNGSHDPLQAALWLCQQCGLSPDALGFRSHRTPPPEGQAETEPGPQPTPRVGRIITGDAHVGAHTAPLWLLKGIIQRSRLYACTSLTGHGKTAVWLHIACMIHAGRQAGALKTYHGNVLYLAGENPSDLAARMLGECRHYKIPSLQLPYVLPSAFPLTDDECDALIKEINALGIEFALIVGDTAASYFPGEDENNNALIGGYARLLRSLTEVAGNPAVVMLSHPIKHASAKDQLLPRGGGAFLNELDGNLTLWSADKEVTSLHWIGKIRGPDFDPVAFRLHPIPTGLKDEDDELEITVVAEPIDEASAANQAQQATANEDLVLRSLHLHHGIRPGQIAVDTGWVDNDGSPQRWKVYQALEGLKRDKLIEQERAKGPYILTAKGKRIIDGET